MEPLGKVVNFSPKGSLIVKAVRAPSAGQTVVDRKQRPLGRVLKVTGPVAGPYVIVAPVRDLEGPMNRLLGTEVFLQSAPPERRPREGPREPGPPRRPPFRQWAGPQRARGRDQGRRDRPRGH